MTARNKYTEAKAALLLNVPFFAALMLDMMTTKIGKFPEVFGSHTPTMATNGKVIWIDEDFINQLTVAEAVFVLCHEIGHAMWRHMGRAKLYLDMGFDGRKFNSFIWNAAGDYVINDMLVKSKIGKMPKMGLLDSKYTFEMVVDDVYRKLLKENECDDCGGTGQAGGGSGEDADGDSTGGDCPSCSGTGCSDGKLQTIDVHINEIADEVPSEAQWKRAVASAKDAAKAMGNMPAHLERFVDSLLEAKVPWEDKLRVSMSRKIGRDTTNWSRPHRRRYQMQGVIMPTYNGFGAGHIVFAIDTSGSMSEDELKQALGECDKILADCNPTRVTLIGCDAHVETVIELYDGDRLAGNIPRIGGGGGTSFIPPFTWVEENGFKPDCLVYFTDTGGQFPSEKPPFPTIWCCSENWSKPPFGEVIMMEDLHNGD